MSRFEENRLFVLNDCHGLGWWHPDGTAKGAARCKHLRLDSEGGGTSPEAVPP